MVTVFSALFREVDENQFTQEHRKLEILQCGMVWFLFKTEVSQDGGSQKAYPRRYSCWLPTETQDCTGNKMILGCSHIFGGNMEA